MQNLSSFDCYQVPTQNVHYSCKDLLFSMSYFLKIYQSNRWCVYDSTYSLISISQLSIRYTKKEMKKEYRARYENIKNRLTAIKTKTIK